jgi:hypothetical protein
MAETRLCSIPGCGKPHRSRGFCDMHYQRFRRNGDPLKVSRIRPAPPKGPDKRVNATHARGRSTKLTEAYVRRIRELKGYNTIDDLAALFGVSPATISSITSRRSWAWLD